jgi:hypothetical protein
MGKHSKTGQPPPADHAERHGQDGGHPYRHSALPDARRCEKRPAARPIHGHLCEDVLPAALVARYCRLCVPIPAQKSRTGRNADQSHRFALTGQDPRSAIARTPCGGRRIWWTAQWVRRVVLTLDTTMTTATALTRAQATEVGRRFEVVR